MKLLRIIGSADPRGGGPIEGILRSSEIMARHGCVNEILCLDDPADPWLKELPLAVHAMGHAIRRYGYSPRLTPWVLDHAGAYDAAIIEGLWNYSSIGAWRGLARRATPYFVFAHGMLDPWFLRNPPLKGVVRRAYWRLLEAKVLADARCVLFTSQEERELAMATYPGRYCARVVAFGAADAPPERSAAERLDLVPALAGRPYLLFLGRIHPKKGCDLLIDAFSLVSEQYPDLALVMAGPDQVGWRPALEQQAARLGVSHRIHWTGMLAGAAKWAALRGAQAFVLPSHQENFGIAVAEAMACSTPVLITERVNIWREIVGAGAGLACDDTAQAVADMLRRFLAMSKEAVTTMRTKGRRCFEQRFEIEAAARELMSVLQSDRTGDADPG
ncbi:MAG: glycosyltransferase [Caulobacteraceae bacterium]|nr:glycosyltransferase [Caulobacteraceae bacterium]